MNDGLSSTAIILSKAEAASLQGDQEDGLKRGMILLSKLTFDWLSIAKGAGKSTAAIGYKAYKLSGDDTAEEAADEISGFLRRAWRRATHRIGEDDTIRRCSRLLGVSRTEIFSIARTSILNSDVIQELVPFYGSVKTVIKGAKGVYDTKKKFNSLDDLKALSAAVDTGFPTVAINGFIKYAKNEAVRSALKTAYNFGKGIAKVLVDIFAAPVSSVVNFVTAVVEAIVSFAYNLLQGALFAKATERARVCVEERMVMTIEDFRKIIGGCPFVGAVFFAGAHYIKHFSLIRLLSNEQRVISTNSLSEGLSKVNEAHKSACKYLQSAAFDLKFRHSADKEEFGWILKAIKGYANDSPKSEFLTDNASAWQRFKHRGKSLFNKTKTIRA